MGRLDGRVAVVTGASRGIGKAIATLFATEGAGVAVVARTEAQWDPRMPGTVHETVAEIAAAGGTAVAIPADLAAADQVETVIERATADFGPVDILINNAALTIPGRPPAGRSVHPAVPSPATRPRSLTAAGTRTSFLTFPLKGYRLHFEIGLFATSPVVQLALPAMIEAGRGSIVNISSLAGFVPGEVLYERPGTPGPFAYGGNKAALTI